MSKQLRYEMVRCGGCPLSCAYRDFVVDGGSFSLPTRNRYRSAQRGERHVDSSNARFADTVGALRVESSDQKEWRYKRRGTVLGKLHAEKLKIWNEATGTCPYQGMGDEVYELSGYWRSARNGQRYLRRGKDRKPCAR